MGDDIQVGKFESADQKLRRPMSLEHLLMLSVGGTIGSGWLFGSLLASSIAGPAAILSWIIGGVFIIFIALTWAEQSSMLPRSGAVVRYPHLTHGAFTGWILGWAYWLAAGSTAPIEAEAVMTYLGGRFPGAHLIVTEGGVKVLTWPQGIGSAIGLMLLFFVLNYVGVRFLAEWNRWFTWYKIILPTVTFCFLFALLKGSNFTAFGGFAPRGIAPIFQALATGGVVFAYLGFRHALEFGGEARRPQRDIPIAIIGGILITVAIYTLLQAAFVGALDWHAAGTPAGAWAKLTAGTWASGPLYQALNAASIGAFAALGVVLLIDAGVSPSGAAWVFVGTTTRANYGLSIDGYCPPFFQRINRFGIPWAALVASFVVGCIFFVPAPSWYILVGFNTSALVLTLVTAALAIPMLRGLAPDVRRPFRLPVMTLMAPVGFLAAVMIVYWAGFATLDNVFAAILVGLPLFAWWYAWRRGGAKPIPAFVLGLVFTGAWVYVNRMGGWTLAASSQTKAPAGAWPFPIYDIAFSAATVFFCVGLWWLSGAEGRRHVRSSAWLIFLILALFPLSYWGEYGIDVRVGFPWSTLIAVGVGLVAYGWGAKSGVVTDELREVLHAAGQKDIGDGHASLLPRPQRSRAGAAPRLHVGP